MTLLGAPAVRFVAVYALLTAVMYIAGERYSAIWCGSIGTIAQLIPSVVVAENVEIETLGGQRVFRMQSHTREMIRTPQRSVPPGSDFDATTLQAYAHQHLVIVFAMLAAWPVPSRRARALLLLGGVPAIVVATLMDVPFVLIGVAQDTILGAVDPQALATDLRVLWFQFLQRGGHPVLSLILGGIVIIIYLRFFWKQTTSSGVRLQVYDTRSHDAVTKASSPTFILRDS
jgi:hypothetical protein